MRCVSTRVLPEPAPARMSSGPFLWVTASRCWGLRGSRIGSDTVINCGSSLSRVGNEVELAGNEIGDGDEVLGRAVAACSALRCLNRAAEGLEDPVGDLAREPAQHAVPVLLDGAAELDDRREARADRPGVPAPQAGLGLPGGVPVQLRESELDAVGAAGPCVHACEPRELGALRIAEPTRVAKPKEAAVLERWPRQLRAGRGATAPGPAQGGGRR